VFFNFQWDFLLLEAGFLAIFLPYGSPFILFLLHWVLFRLRFLSGLSKLLSGDESWANFTALKYYFETQPLPHIGAWYAHQLPEWLLRAGVGWTFFVELLVPFLMFLPRQPRLFAAWTTIVMQVLILLTSNHNFFNLLTIVLCLLLFDDRAFRWMHYREWSKPAARGVMGNFLRVATPVPGRIANAFAGLLAVVILSSTLSMMWSRPWAARCPPSTNRWCARWCSGTSSATTMSSPSSPRRDRNWWSRGPWTAKRGRPTVSDTSREISLAGRRLSCPINRASTGRCGSPR